MNLNLNPPSPIIRRVLSGMALVLAFMVMASVFSPERTRAGGLSDPLPGIPPHSVEYGTVDRIVVEQSGSSNGSVNPHEGLNSLGAIEDRGYTIHIYATEVGPRYSIYENATGREIGALLSAEKVHQGFPELNLPTMEFNADSPLMLVDTPRSQW